MIRRWLQMRRFMREHRFTHTHISEYIDGELDESSHHRVEEHVGLCPECRRMLEALRRTLTGLMGLHEGETGGAIADGVIQRLRNET